MRKASLSETGTSCGAADTDGCDTGATVGMIVEPATDGTAEAGAIVGVAAADGAGAPVDAVGALAPAHAVAATRTAPVISALIVKRAAKSLRPGGP